nr:GTPase HRas isoform 6 [Homo sapiens]UJY53512.1 GTPase HRas isoform 6 [Homo sapiens]
MTCPWCWWGTSVTWLHALWNLGRLRTSPEATASPTSRPRPRPGREWRMPSTRWCVRSGSTSCGS